MKKLAKSMKRNNIIQFLFYIIMGLYVYGEVRCIAKAVTCDWKPIGKAEVIYTGAAVTVLGGIVGWFDIKDSSL